MTLVSLIAVTSCRVQMPPPENACVAATQYRRDVDAALRYVRDDYVYRNDKAVDWSRAEAVARREADTVHSKRELVGVLERFLDNLYDAHAVVRANTAHSPRLVPSGLDLWAEWSDSEAIVTAVRPGFGAERQGVRPGMRVLSINGVPIRAAAAARLGAAVRSSPPPEARAWSLLSALAGRHDTPRVLRVLDVSGATRDIAIETTSPYLIDQSANNPPVEARWITSDSSKAGNGVRYGYIRLNALDDSRSVAAFDSVLSMFREAPGIILDLRNTAGGGNTSVAEPIMGRFLTKTSGYQRVIPRHGDAYVRSVAPRGPWTYTGSVVALVGRWTGSMGEGMAIGLDGMHRATVVGTAMAGLSGAVDDFKLPCSGISIALPTARLLHLNGTPREKWLAPVLVDLRTGVGDAALSRAVSVLDQTVGSSHSDRSN